MISRPKITVIVTCFNSEAVIRPCLESASWADEVFVVDSFSTDSTVDIVKEFGSRLVQHEYLCAADQKNWAIPQAEHEWVLILDTDERITPELRAEIETVVGNPEGCSGYWISRLNYVFGKPLKHNPDWQLRLFLRDRGRYGDRQVHEQYKVDGTAGRLKNPLLHFNVRDLNQVNKVWMMKYAYWEAIQRNRDGVRFRPWHLFTRPIRAFVYRYFFQLQLLNGLEGFFWSAYMAGYFFLAYAWLWEMQRTGDANGARTAD